MILISRRRERAPSLIVVKITKIVIKAKIPLMPKPAPIIFD